MAGITDSRATRRERDVARFLECIQEHGHRNSGKAGKD